MKRAVQRVDTSSLKDVVCRAESAMTQTRKFVDEMQFFKLPLWEVIRKEKKDE